MNLRHFNTTLCLCMATAMLAAPAEAARNTTYDKEWYLGASGDLTWTEHSNTGGGGNINLGYHFTPDWRIEGQLGYHHTPGESGYSNTHYLSYMGYVYYDINQLNLTPNSNMNL